MNTEKHIALVKEFKRLNPSLDVLDRFKTNYTPAFVAFLEDRIESVR